MSILREDLPLALPEVAVEYAATITPETRSYNERRGSSARSPIA